MRVNRRLAQLRPLSFRANTCRLLIFSLVFTLLIPLTDCKVTKTVRLDPSMVKQPEKEKIVGVTTADGQDIRFDPNGARLDGNTLQASVNGAPYQIALDHVQRFWVERKVVSKGRTIGLIIGVTAGAFVATVAIALALK